MTRKHKKDEPPADLHARLLEDISSGALTGGERLVVADLALRYQTSTNPVREALRHLQGQGLVEFETNRGARIVQGNDHAVRDTFEILQLLEPYFVRWFAEFSTDADQAELLQIQESMETGGPLDNGRLTELDQMFHARIARTHYNTRAIALWHAQRAALSAYSLHLPVSENRVAAIKSEHRALLAAFSARDPEAAAAAITRHIANAGQHLYDQMRNRAVRDAAHDAPASIRV